MQSTIINRHSKISWFICAAALVSTACSSGSLGLFRQYEYEEEMYLSLDGTATVYVNSSLAALDALRGAAFDTRPTAPLDREKVRGFYTTPVTHVAAMPTTSRRRGRRFVQVRLDVADIRRLGEAAPFAWSQYDFNREGELYVFRQQVGQAARTSIGNVGWDGREMVAFRLHLPSEIVDHNAGPGYPKRGNILAWEQPLSERLRGKRLAFDVTMKTQSILYRTLWLFAATVATVAVMFAIVIWWILRRGRGLSEPAVGTGTGN